MARRQVLRQRLPTTRRVDGDRWAELVHHRQLHQLPAVADQVHRLEVQPDADHSKIALPVALEDSAVTPEHVRSPGVYLGQEPGVPFAPSRRTPVVDASEDGDPAPGCWSGRRRRRRSGRHASTAPGQLRRRLTLSRRRTVVPDRHHDQRHPQAEGQASDQAAPLPREPSGWSAQPGIPSRSAGRRSGPSRGVGVTSHLPSMAGREARGWASHPPSLPQTPDCPRRLSTAFGADRLAAPAGERRLSWVA